MAYNAYIGSLLVRGNAISRMQLRQALQLQRSQPHKPIGSILLEQRCLHPATLTRYLCWQKWLRFLGMLIALLGTPTVAMADTVERHDLFGCDTPLCTENVQAGVKTLTIDLLSALQSLKEMMQSPYANGDNKPLTNNFKQESQLRLNLKLSGQQPGLEIQYRF